MKNRMLKLILMITVLMGVSATFVFAAPQDFMVLCYHDITDDIKKDDFAVDRKNFIATLEYLRTHDFHFVSLQDIVDANKDIKPLPKNAVLLTFDDAYRSYYDFVHPMLKEYGIPSTLAVVTSWIDQPPATVLQPLMNWDQIREVAESPLVEIVSHSDKLHEGVYYNPQGNTAAAGNSRLFDAVKVEYEDEAAFRSRIHDDIEHSVKILKEKLGKDVRAIAWPYGRFNVIGVEEAMKQGIGIHFGLNDLRANTADLEHINRYVIHENPDIADLVKYLKIVPVNPTQLRIMQADLDLIYDDDPAQTESNLGKFLERVKAMKVSAVYLQAFSDLKGDGNIDEVYFPNSVLPMRADLFNRVVHQLRTRCEVEVYAWMPMLSLSLPDIEQSRRLRVREFKDGEIVLTTSWYQRLSPFSPEAQDLITKLYEEMAVNATVDGVVFQDDGYLNDFEDYSDDALVELKKITDGELLGPKEMSAEQQNEWTGVKVRAINSLSLRLMDAVRRQRPDAKFVRTLYADVVSDRESRAWYAQDYFASLNLYDYVTVLAYPKMEKVKAEDKWLKQLVMAANEYPEAFAKTVFKVQTYDWEKTRWIDAKTMDRWLDTLVAAGARHLAYYPDNFIENQPQRDVIRRMMSVEDFPFARAAK